MLAVSHPSSSSLDLIYPGVMDESGTINPAALNASGAASTIAPNLLSQSSPRGTKRGRSPVSYGVQGQEAEGEDAHTNKRSKPLNQPGSPTQQMSYSTAQHPMQTPQIKTQALPQASPSQVSPTRSTPGSATKPTIVKALPTVRDHTTDQLGPEQDEYLPRESDPEGETKVTRDGEALQGRKYRCRTFKVPKRGEKLFMLATECARVLGYRDSYLLFNKNRSLYKIIADQTEKDNLIHQEILPYSYRSRQIAIVTARSMFRQFGSRLITDGRRVRDDYWVAKARKQGFTEEDPAGEKRPGAAKAREQAAAEASNSALTSMPHGEVIYNNDGQPSGLAPISLAPLPMIHVASEDLRPNTYGGVMRPRQEIAGPAYQDRTQSSSQTEILHQAASAAEFNKQIGQTRAHRAKYLNDYWARPHEQPILPEPSATESGNAMPQQLTSPQAVAGMGHARTQQDQMSHQSAQMMSQGYGGYHNPQNPMASPVQQMHRSMPGAQMHGNAPMTSHRQTPSYGGYPSNQMWQTPQPQPSPLAQSHHMPQYAQGHQHQSSMPPPQMPQQSSMGYGQMPQMGNAAFAGMNRNLYQQQSPNAQHYGMQSSGGGQQPGMQGWSAPGSGGMQDWQRYQ